MVKEALSALGRAYRTVRQAKADTDPAVIAITKDLGCAYLAAGDTERALLHLRQALKSEIRVHGAVSNAVAGTLNNLGMAMLQAGDAEACLLRLQQALDMRLNLLGEKDPRVALTVKSIGAAHLVQGEAERALKYLRKALEIESEALVDWTTQLEAANTRFYMAKALERLGEAGKARAHYQSAAAVFAVRLGAANAQTREAVHRAEQLALAPYDSLRGLRRGFGGDDGEWLDGIAIEQELANETLLRATVSESNASLLERDRMPQAKLLEPDPMSESQAPPEPGPLRAPRSRSGDDDEAAE
jgi:tetratricopeptide (TPR) repeat protein